MWTGNRSRTDRILAAVEIPALGLWCGALCGFAFIGAPIAFHIVGTSDVTRFAALTSANLSVLAIVGYVFGALAVATILVRSRDAADRRLDFVRALLVLIALGLLGFESASIVPAMAQIADVRSDAYHALHGRSTFVYGAIVVLTFAALVLAAVRSDE